MNAQLSPKRVDRLTGSRVAAILGVNPYSSAADVMREMVRQHFGAPQEFTGNEATRHGQEHERDALAAYEAERGVMTHGGQTFSIHPDHDFLAVSPDGFVGDDGLIECKAPFRGRYTTIAEVPYYLPQVMLQIECTGRKWCDFVVWREGRITVSRIERDPFWLPRHLPALQAFHAAYLQTIADPALAATHLADLDRTDRAWANASRDYLLAVAAADAAEANVKAQREVLLSLAGDASAKGCGVQVIRSERAGSVAYAKALKDLAPGADLSAYTGSPSIVFTVKDCK